MYLFWLMLAYPDTSSAICPCSPCGTHMAGRHAMGSTHRGASATPSPIPGIIKCSLPIILYLCMFHARGRLWTSDRPTRSNQAVMRNPSLFINAQYPKLLFNACMSCVKKSGGYRAKEGYRRRKSEMQRCIGASDPVTSFGVRSARGTPCPGVSTCRASRQSRRSLSQPGS